MNDSEINKYYEPILDQSNGEAPPTVPNDHSLTDLEIRKFCLINAGTLVINTAGATKSVSPMATIALARDFYLFLVAEDRVVDADDPDYPELTNVVQMADYKH